MLSYLEMLKDMFNECGAFFNKILYDMSNEVLSFTEFTAEQVCPRACIPLLDELTNEESSVDSPPAQLLHKHIQGILNVAVASTEKKLRSAQKKLRKAWSAKRHAISAEASHSSHSEARVDQLWHNSSAEGEEEGEEGEEGEEVGPVAMNFLSSVRQAIARCESCMTEGQSWSTAAQAC
eukprot:1101970-Prymnesium_polylepis.1